MPSFKALRIPIAVAASFFLFASLAYIPLDFRSSRSLHPPHTPQAQSSVPRPIPTSHTTTTTSFLHPPLSPTASPSRSNTSTPHPESLPPPPPIKDNFPQLSLHPSPPSVHPSNRPATDHPSLPLLVAFTRTWPLLQQSLASYLAAGWPASSIYIVDNTGSFTANALSLLSLQNPFFLNYTRLHQLGIPESNILRTPALLTFSQLQNYFLSVAIEKRWGWYYWGHMDTVVLSHEGTRQQEGGEEEEEGGGGYKSFYQRVVEDYKLAVEEGRGGEDGKAVKAAKGFGVRFYSYDRLALVNVSAYLDVGGWDTMIPYYLSDCDMHSRLLMAGYALPSVTGKVGYIFDVNTYLPDVGVFYRKNIGGAEFEKLKRELQEMEERKEGRVEERNRWQGLQRGGEGERFWVDGKGFGWAVEKWVDVGREVFRKKWGWRDCDLVYGAGRKLGDAWKVKDTWQEKRGGSEGRI